MTRGLTWSHLSHPLAPGVQNVLAEHQIWQIFTLSYLFNSRIYGKTFSYTYLDLYNKSNFRAQYFLLNLLIVEL